MKTSTIVVMGILGLAATPLALHLAGGSSGTTRNWIKTLHGGSGTGAHAGSGVPKVPGVPGVPQDAQETKPAPKPATATIAGKWTVTISSDQGDLVLTMELKQEGRSVTGTITNPHGDGTLPVAGELVERALTLAVDTDAGHGDMHLAFKGAPNDDGSLAGTMTSAMGESKWTATRAKS